MSVRINRGEMLLPLFFAGLGAVWIAGSLGMPLWEGFAPESGFLPLVYGALLIALSGLFGLQLAAGRHAAVETESARKPLVILAILTATVVGIDIAGFALSIFLMLLALYAAVERLPVVASVAVSFGITAALVLIFKVWLRIPLPLGLMGV
jgi:putative tricarboxylic transport membrane protein